MFRAHHLHDDRLFDCYVSERSGETPDPRAAWFILLKGLIDGAINPSLIAVVEHIRQGTLDFVLIKPADAQFLVSTAKFEVWRIVDVFASLAVFVWAFSPEFKIIRAARAGSSADAKSLQVIMVGMNVAFFGSFFLAWVPALRFTSAYILPAFWLGIALLISGSLLRRHCFRMLGQSFTVAGLGAVSGLGEADLERRLKMLVRREVLTRDVDQRSAAGPARDASRDWWALLGSNQ